MGNLIHLNPFASLAYILVVTWQQISFGYFCNHLLQELCVWLDAATITSLNMEVQWNPSKADTIGTKILSAVVRCP